MSSIPGQPLRTGGGWRRRNFLFYFRREIINDPVIDLFRSVMLPKLIEHFQPEDKILYGSRVQETAHDESDLDVILVSESFIV